MTANGGPGARSFAALEDLAAARDRLRMALEAVATKDAAAPLDALWWSLADAPEVGFELMASARELTHVANGIVSEDLVQDNPLADLAQAELITSRITLAAQHQNRFSREATVHRLHASGDLLAEVVNSTLNLGIEKKRCTLVRVVKKLKGRPGCKGLIAALKELKTSEEYRGLASVKALKGRNLPPGSIDASPGEERPAAPLQELRAQADVLRGLEASVLEQLATLISAPPTSPRAR